MKSDPEEDSSSSDEMGPADGRERYWMFVNGEQVRFFAALVGAFFAVVSCFLYVLGIGESFVRTALLAIIGGSFLVWRVFDLELRNYQRNNWKKDRRSPRLRKVELKVAFGLWLFIFLVIGDIMLIKWHLVR